MGKVSYLQKLSDALSKKNDIILELNNMSSHYILSIKAYSLLKEVCINFCGSTTSFLKGKEGSLKRKRIQIQIYVSVLQNGWVTLGPFHVLVLLFGFQWL